MKKVYQLFTVLGLSLLTIGAVAQSISHGNMKTVLPARHLVKAPHMSHNTHKSTGVTTYAFLDYAVVDSVIATKAGEDFLGSPTVGGFYIQDMNMHYVMKDTGADGTDGVPANSLLVRSCSVAFDTLLDISGMGYSGQNVVVDSLYIPIGQGNTSGKNDTLIVQINSLGAYGIPTATVLWSKTIIQDTGLSGTGNPWNYPGLLALAPNLTLTGTSKFAVTLKYYDETKKDTCGFLYATPAYNCTALGGDIPDTTFIGGVMPVTGAGNLRANSFSTGFNYYTGASPSNSNPILTLPSTSYGDAFYYACTPDTLPGMDWQDIAIYAEVSFTSILTDVNSVTDKTFSVSQNYPNPFNQSTVITYTLTKTSDVSFSVFDIAGRVLVNNSYNNATVGQHTISLNANQFTPGVYFYTFNINGNSVTKKMVITE